MANESQPEKKDDIIARSQTEQQTGQSMRSNVISTVVIVALVAVGIYFASRNPETKEESPADEAKQEEPAVTAEAVEADESSISVDSTDPAESPEASEEAVVATPVKENVAEVTSTPSTDGTYQETAKKGEGTTHLARRALSSYLKDHSDTGELTAAKKIYIEDYLRKHTTNRGLTTGETVSFSQDLVKEAITKANGLSQTQLNHLETYTTRVATL